MGVCLGTLSWDTRGHDVDKRLKEQLMYSAKKYNLSEADVNFRPSPQEGKSNFSIEISGFDIWWNGGKHKCDFIINKFLDKSQEKYKELCYMDKSVQYLPM